MQKILEGRLVNVCIKYIMQNAEKTSETGGGLIIVFDCLMEYKNSEYDQEIPQWQTEHKPMAPRGRAT